MSPKIFTSVFYFLLLLLLHPELFPRYRIPTRPTTPSSLPTYYFQSHFPLDFKYAPSFNELVDSIPLQECIAGVVTCCFSARQSLVSLYVNGTDITQFVSSNTELADDVKIITFFEPLSPATLAIKGHVNDNSTVASLSLTCKSSRVGSQWTFVSPLSFVSNWKTIPP